MWGNITKHVGAAIQKVQKLQNELESQLDAAVGAEDSASVGPTMEFLPLPVINLMNDGSDVDGSAVSNIVDDAMNQQALVVDCGAHIQDDVERDGESNTTNVTVEITSNSTINNIEEMCSETIAKSVGTKSVDEWDFDINITEQNDVDSLLNLEDVPPQIKVISSAEVSIESATIASDVEHPKKIEPISSVFFVDAPIEGALVAAVTEVPVEIATVEITLTEEAPNTNTNAEEGRIALDFFEENNMLSNLHISPPIAVIEVDMASPDIASLPTEASVVKNISTVKSKKTKLKSKVPMEESVEPQLTAVHLPHDSISSIPIILDMLAPMSAVELVDSIAVEPTDDMTRRNSVVPDDAMFAEPTLIIEMNSRLITTSYIDSVKEESHLLKDKSGDHVGEHDNNDGDSNSMASSIIVLRDKYEQKMIDMESKHSAALTDQQISFTDQVKLVKLEAEATAIADKSQTEFDAKAQSDIKDAADAEIKMEFVYQIEQLNHSLACAKKELAESLSLASQRESSLAKLTIETSKINEVVTERERALESYAIKMAETHKQLEVAQRRILDLSAEMTEKDTKLRQSQVNAAGDGELKKQLLRAQEIMKEKEERLAAFEQEGQSLAKKQSEMEKVVRTTKAEVKKRDVDIAKLKESKEQLVKAIEEMQDLVRKNELEASSAMKSLSAMQAVSQASTDKLSRLEGDIGSKAEELASQRKAMEAAWAENNESKRIVAELKADRDDLRRQIGLGTSKVMETESSRRDIEQREAVLRATNKQLQDSLQRQMQESSVREERLRDEVGEMRKRWQEAITSRETLSSELGSATAPLLRQISSMQDTLRMKSESWQAVEASLSERALRAESVAEIAELKKTVLEEQTNELKLQVGLLGARLHEALIAAHSAESVIEKLQKSEVVSADKMVELESRLSLEIGQKQSFQSSLRELELRHKIEQQDAKDAVDLISQQGEGQLYQLQAETQALREQLERERKGDNKRNSSRRLQDKDTSSFGSSSSGNGNSNSNGNGHFYGNSAGSHHDLGDMSATAHGYRQDGMKHGINQDENNRSYSIRHGGNMIPDVILPSKFNYC